MEFVVIISGLEDTEYYLQRNMYTLWGECRDLWNARCNSTRTVSDQVELDNLSSGLVSYKYEKEEG